MSIMCGNNVHLRPIEMNDAEILCRWKNDESIYMYLGGGYHPTSFSQYFDWMKNMIDQDGTSRRYMISDKDKKPLGMIGLYDINWINQTCEVGLFIGEKESRRLGAATEAYQLLEKYAQMYLNIRKINLKVVDENVQGKSFWIKMGFETIGVMHAERYINGKYCDVNIMEKFIR